MTISVAIGGATGWTGAPLAAAVHASDDLTLRAGIARGAAGHDLGSTIAQSFWDVPVYAELDAALHGVDVYVDYTRHDVVKAHALAAIARGVHVVIGSSGLTADDFEVISEAAQQQGVGVIAAGNFALTAALAQKAAVMVAEHLPTWEIIDYASYAKPDAPSGTARELAEKLGAVHAPGIGVPVDAVAGPQGIRGADVAGSRVHSVRQPGFVVSTQVVFGLPSQRLTIAFDAGESPQPYVDGTLLAIRRVMDVRGLVRGLESLL